MPVRAKTVGSTDSSSTLEKFDTSLCLQRLTLNHCTLEEALVHELSPLPPALFSEDGFMRDSGKAKRARDLCKKWGVIVEKESLHLEATIVDGGMLVNHLKKAWKQGDLFVTFGNHTVKYVDSLAQDRPLIVVLDGYKGTSTKNHIQSKRRSVKSIEVQATPDMRLLSSIGDFMSHPKNKQRLMDLLANAVNESEQTHLTARQCDGDADTDIVKAAVENTAQGTVLIKADDSDILFLALAQTDTKNLYLERSGVVYDIQATKENLPDTIADTLLVLHGYFGSDVTSGFYRRPGIFSTNWEPVKDSLHVFLNPDSSEDEIKAAGRVLIAHRYKCSLPLNDARCKLFKQKCSNKSAKQQVNIATLPPSEDAADLHSLRAFLAIQEWLGNTLDPLEFGWKMVKEELKPIPSTLDPAPRSLMEIRQCHCVKSRCVDKHCKCKKANSFCTDLCQCLYCENVEKVPQEQIVHDFDATASENESDDDDVVDVGEFHFNESDEECELEEWM